MKSKQNFPPLLMQLPRQTGCFRCQLYQCSSVSWDREDESKTGRKSLPCPLVAQINMSTIPARILTPVYPNLWFDGRVVCLKRTLPGKENTFFSFFRNVREKPTSSPYLVLLPDLQCSKVWYIQDYGSSLTTKSVSLLNHLMTVVFNRCSNNVPADLLISHLCVRATINSTRLFTSWFTS